MAEFITSKDGTRIAYERIGSGPPLILVDGALCYRASGPARPLAALLADRFTVFFYDRRGRGESGDTLPYAIEREVEDLAAMVETAGGSPYVYGISSGAALALEAASRGLPIRKLALYESPCIVDGTHVPIPADFLRRLQAVVAAGRRGEAVKMFLRLVDLPSIALLMMPLMPAWSKLKAVAHTLPYDITIVQDNQRGQPFRAGRWSGATMPTLAMDGSRSPAWMRNGMRALAGMLPNAAFRTLDGQTHMVKAAALAPVLTEFFSG
jgi:pimeloyl-ACP methyl ester carboxylesterase